MSGQEVVTALAAAGGTAVVQAAGGDAWESVRDRVAELLGRGRRDHVQRAQERLDQTAAELEAGGPDEAEMLKRRLAAAWQARFEMVLEDLDDGERAAAIGQLEEIITQAAAGTSRVTAAGGGVAIGGNATFRAEGGSVAAASVHGGVHLAIPPSASGLRRTRLQHLRRSPRLGYRRPARQANYQPRHPAARGHRPVRPPDGGVRVSRDHQRRPGHPGRCRASRPGTSRHPRRPPRALRS
jgi:hypothetical protein